MLRFRSDLATLTLSALCLAASPLAALPYSLAFLGKQADILLKVTEHGPEGPLSEGTYYRTDERFPIDPARDTWVEQVDRHGNLLDQARPLPLALVDDATGRVVCRFQLSWGTAGDTKRAIERGPGEQLAAAHMHAFDSWVASRGGSILVGPKSEASAHLDSGAPGTDSLTATGAGALTPQLVQGQPRPGLALPPPARTFTPSTLPTPEREPTSGSASAGDVEKKDSPARGRSQSRQPSASSTGDRSAALRRSRMLPLPPVPIFTKSTSPSVDEERPSSPASDRDGTGKGSPVRQTLPSQSQSLSSPASGDGPAAGLRPRQSLRPPRSVSPEPADRSRKRGPSGDLEPPRAGRTLTEEEEQRGLEFLFELEQAAQAGKRRKVDLGLGAGEGSMAGPTRATPYVLRVTGLAAGQSLLFSDARTPEDRVDLGAVPSPRLVANTGYLLQPPAPEPGRNLVAQLKVFLAEAPNSPLAEASVVWNCSGAMLLGKDAAWTGFLIECKQRHNIDLQVNAQLAPDLLTLQATMAALQEPVQEPGPGMALDN